jgi:hypothetical protein
VWRAVALVVISCGRIDFAVPLSAIGCSDGEREGYVDLTAFPTIAACAATWTGQADLRAAPTGAPCGDDLGTCNVPADACAPGWHVCASSGDVTELLALSASDCLNVPGRFVAASGHCLDPTACTYPPPGAFQCLDTSAACRQPICCGTGCSIPQCTDGVWPGKTRENAISGEGCAITPAKNQDGLLCCRG